jgi:hypothetical protein
LKKTLIQLQVEIDLEVEEERNKVETKASSCNFLQSHSVK